MEYIFRWLRYTSDSESKASTLESSNWYKNLNWACLKGRAAEGAREVVEINGGLRRSWDREEAPSAAGKNDIVCSSLLGKAAKVSAFLLAVM